MTIESWFEKNDKMIFFILLGNMVIPPFLLGIIFSSEVGQSYFLIVGIGIPYIICTAGQLMWYNKAPEAKEYLNQIQERITNENIQRKPHGLEKMEHDKLARAKRDYNKAKSLDDLFFRMAGFLKIFTLIGGILFFTTDALDGLHNYLLNLGGNEKKETFTSKTNVPCSCEESIEELNTKIISLQSKVKSLLNNETLMKKPIKTEINIKGPKTKL